MGKISTKLDFLYIVVSILRSINVRNFKMYYFGIKKG